MGLSLLVCVSVWIMAACTHSVAPPRRETLGAIFAYRGQTRPLAARKLFMLKIMYPWLDNKVPRLNDLKRKTAACQNATAEKQLYCEEIITLSQQLADARGLRLSLNNQFWSVVIGSFSPSSTSSPSHTRYKRQIRNATAGTAFNHSDLSQQLPAAESSINASKVYNHDFDFLSPTPNSRAKRQLEGIPGLFDLFTPLSEGHWIRNGSEVVWTLNGSEIVRYNSALVRRRRQSREKRQLEGIQGLFELFMPITEKQWRQYALRLAGNNHTLVRRRRQLDAFDVAMMVVGVAPEDQVTDIQAQQVILMENEKELRGKIEKESQELSAALKTLSSRDDLILAAVEKEIDQTVEQEQVIFGNLTNLLASHARIRSVISLVLQQNGFLISSYSNLMHLLAQIKLEQPLTALYRYAEFNVTYSNIALARYNISFHRTYLQLNLSVPIAARAVTKDVFHLYSFLPLMVRAHPNSSHFAYPRPDYTHLAINGDNKTIPLTSAQMDLCISGHPSCGDGWTLDDTPTTCIEGLYSPVLSLVRERCAHRLIVNHTKPMIQIIKTGVYLLSNVPRITTACTRNDTTEITTLEVLVDSVYTVACDCVMTVDHSDISFVPGKECDSVNQMQGIISLSMYLPLLNLEKNDWESLTSAISNESSTLRITLPRTKTPKAEHAKLQASEHDLETLSQELLEPIGHGDETALHYLMSNLSMPVLLKIVVCVAAGLGIINLVCWCILRRRLNNLSRLLLPGVVHSVRAESDLWKPSSAESEFNYSIEEYLILNTYLIVTVIALVTIAIGIRAVGVYLYTRRSGWTRYEIFVVVSNLHHWLELQLTTFRPTYQVHDNLLVSQLNNIPRAGDSRLSAMKMRFLKYKLKMTHGPGNLKQLKLNPDALIYEDLPTEIEVTRDQYKTLTTIINSPNRVRVRYYAVKGNMMLIPIREEIRLPRANSKRQSDKNVRISTDASTKKD